MGPILLLCFFVLFSEPPLIRTNREKRISNLIKRMREATMTDLYCYPKLSTVWSISGEYILYKYS